MSNARADLARAVRSLFNLKRHEMSEEPKIPAQEVALVQLPGSTTLKAAIWRDGEWRTDRGRPFAKRPLCWFSIEVRK